MTTHIYWFTTLAKNSQTGRYHTFSVIAASPEDAWSVADKQAPRTSLLRVTSRHALARILRES